LHVAKISRFATSALAAGKQPLYCMGRADLKRIGETASISFLYNNCVLVVSAGGFQFAEECHLPHASPRSGAHCSGTTAVVSLTGSSVPRQGDDSSIHVTSFSTALAIAVLSPPVTSLSALAPAQRAGAQRLRALARLRNLHGWNRRLLSGVVQTRFAPGETFGP
jgi:hypothetical protein